MPRHRAPRLGRGLGPRLPNQELSLATNLSAAENIFAGHEPRRFGIVDCKALIIGVINNGMNLLSVPFFYQLIVKGVVILVAVCIDVQTKKRHG